MTEEQDRTEIDPDDESQQSPERDRVEEARKLSTPDKAEGGEAGEGNGDEGEASGGGDDDPGYTSDAKDDED
jgi:hypothetical protein